MTVEDARRERNRRRWRRRRTRRIAALLILFPLMVGAGLLGSNVVSVLGAAPGAAPADTGSAGAREHRYTTPRQARRKSEQVPISIPVPQPYDLREMRSLPRTVRQYYETGSHISPHVKRELTRLASLGSQPTRIIVLPQRGITPPRLYALDTVFQPGPPPDIVERYREDDRFQRERDFIELAPDLISLPTSTAVPEPGTGVLVAVGLTMIAGCRRRRLPA